MLAVKVEPKNAEQVKQQLIQDELFAQGYKILSKEGFIYFPVTERKGKYDFVDIELDKLKRKPKVKDLVKERFSKNLKTSMEVVGDIAIVEVDNPEDEAEFGKIVIESNPNVKTVLNKSGIHEGKFRTQKMKVIAGEKTKETVHKENNARLKLNVEKVYFSARLSTERKRILDLVKKGESVLVMFSGCGPYPCVIAKNTEAEEVFGVEMNPEGHKYAKENVKLNKLNNVKLYCGDVNDILPKLKKKFDRILMPLPKTAEDFLDSALKVCKKGTIIHFYNFLKEEEFYKAHEWINAACLRAKKKCKILETIKCGQHAPYVFRVCVDFKII
jgi:tRNA (guanine37-N1)-methyltransferase